ncbi:MAG: fumarate hydratase [Anaerolineaceae bacterium]
MSAPAIHLPDLVEALVELIRRTSTDLPAPVEARLRAAMGAEEPGSSARGVLEAVLQNVSLARQNSIPICQDTGTPFFLVKYPSGLSTLHLKSAVRAAVVQATKLLFLRPNAVESLTGVNNGNNLGGQAFPLVEFEEIESGPLTIDLLLKGGGCENCGAQRSLPSIELQAGRDLEGVRKAVLDAVHRAQGEGCAPGFLGVAIGGDRASAYQAAKGALLQDVDQPNPDPDLAALETRLLEEANQLGIGPMGLGGSSTLLGVHLTALHRLPASYFVTVSYICWAYRRRRLIFSNGLASYE